MSNRVRRHRSRNTSAIDYSQPAPAADGSSQPGRVASSVLWLIGWIVWIGTAVLLSVAVIGAFKFSLLAGLGTLVPALIVAYFMVRER